jgi:arginine deiminase
MSLLQGVDSEVGQLRTVLMHRPGPELERITPRHSGRLLFGSLPWVSKARQEHDLLCQALRDHGVHVLYLTELLQDCLEYQAARSEAVRMAVADAGLGEELRGQLRSHLEDLGPEQLAQVLIAGLTPQELKVGHGVVYELLDRHDFVLDPLPNLVFTRDASFWVGDQVAVASLVSGRRRRETDLATIIYRHHPRFAGIKWLYESDLEHVDGGDVLLLAPGVVAIGVGQRTAPAGAERLARRLFETGLAHTVLAVPISQTGGAGHLDTVCAVLDVDAVVMHPSVAYALTAHTISPRGEGMRMSRPQPFLQAAAQAMGIDRLHVIDSGTDPIWGQPGQRDDGSNVLAVGRRVAISHERNSETNTRLEAAGVRVIRVPSSELGSIRGGPRCMTCPVSREPAALPAEVAAGPDLRAAVRRDAAVILGQLPVPDSRPPSQLDRPDSVQIPEPVPVPASTGAAAGGAAYAGQADPDRADPDRADPDRADPDRADKERAELASASLEPAARPATRATRPGRPAAEPEHAEHHEGRGDDQGDHREPDEGLHDRRGDEHYHDRGDDYHQHPQHDFTLRRWRASGRGRVPVCGRPARSNGKNQPLHNVFMC